MQKLFIIFLVLAMYFSFAPASGPISIDPDWIDLNEQTVLTIRLPANPTTGYEWSFDIADPDVLELITMEYIADAHSQKITGSGGTWVASFRGLNAGTTALTLIYAAIYDDTSIADVRILEVHVAEDLSITASNLDDDSAVWYEQSEDKTAITVRLPANATTGYAWNFASEPEIMEHVTETYLPDEGEPMLVGQGGTWVANFRAVPGKSGDTELILSYQRTWESEPIDVRTLALTVNEDGTLEIQAITIEKR